MRSVNLPLPSSPHWVPTTMVAGTDAPGCRCSGGRATIAGRVGKPHSGAGPARAVPGWWPVGLGIHRRRFARKASSRTRRAALGPLVRVQPDPTLVRLGSAGCGWWVPADVVVPGAVAYCAGAGEDITFDLEL